MDRKYFNISKPRHSHVCKGFTIINTSLPSKEEEDIIREMIAYTLMNIRLLKSIKTKVSPRMPNLSVQNPTKTEALEIIFNLYKGRLVSKE